jgi:glycosyltransferase involved in cell wall biosynthesis
MKLSIITINYNNAEGLRKTMESVLKQTYHDFEYIIVDGASTDGSVDVVREYENQLHITHSAIHLLWSSEKDNGIYDAMNRGIRKAKGEYTLMLNSGDFFVDEYVLERIIPELDGTDIVQGNVIEEYPDKVIRNRGYGKSDIDFFDVMNGYFLHQASFIHIDTLKKYGYYDESYKKGADTYFYITTLALGHASFKYVDVDVANFDVNGISNMQDPKWVQIDKEEDARWYGEHISMRLMNLCHTAPKKIRLYDTLHRHKLIWYITMILVRLSLWITPMPKKVKLEKIK